MFSAEIPFLDGKGAPIDVDGFRKLSQLPVQPSERMEGGNDADGVLSPSVFADASARSRVAREAS